MKILTGKEEFMPVVKGKHYKYNKAGYKQAAKARSKKKGKK